ncbi:MAG TPA: LPXTG cell wall anchor domain-containing protein [Desulfatiglandales bacterium]|nr:LPXTG cell wall anchor domain-containing protein [Desulfatiglandales bacterium]
MEQKGTGDSLKHKALIFIICTIGIVAVSYGMAKDDNLIFVIGVLFVIGGYLLVRRRIKKHIRNGP